MRNYPLMSEEEENEMEGKVHTNLPGMKRRKAKMKFRDKGKIKPPTLSTYNETDYNFNINEYLLSLIPQEEQDRVFNQRYADITPEFLGFVETYYYLSKLIPQHWTVVDLGCGYNPQSYFFTNHAHYIAVDIGYIEGELTEMFKPPNCGIYRLTVKEFLFHYLNQLDTKTTFAICNYVPSWYGDNGKITREYFENVYVFYPHHKREEE